MEEEEEEKEGEKEEEEEEEQRSSYNLTPRRQDFLWVKLIIINVNY